MLYSNIRFYHTYCAIVLYKKNVQRYNTIGNQAIKNNMTPYAILPTVYQKRQKSHGILMYAHLFDKVLQNLHFYFL